MQLEAAFQISAETFVPTIELDPDCSVEMQTYINKVSPIYCLVWFQARFEHCLGYAYCMNYLQAFEIPQQTKSDLWEKAWSKQVSISLKVLTCAV